jgi:YD repeat-containing protein
MKKYFYLLISVLLISCGKNTPISDLQQEKWNGKIKTITISTFFYDSTKATPHLGKLINKSIREFNTEGNEISYTYINEEDEVESIRKSSFNEEKIKNESKETDEEGNLLYTTKYKYDGNNNLIEIITTKHNTNSVIKQVNLFDEKNNLIGMTGYEGNNQIDFTAANKYDLKNQLIEEKIYLGDGTLDYRAVNDYDDKGRLVKNTGFAKDSTRIWELKYDYKVFDKEGNCLLKEVYRDSVLIKVEQLQIEYHPQ